MGEKSSKFNHSRWFSKNHRRVICVGLKNSGKSSITSYLTMNYPRAAKPLPEIGCYKFKVDKFTIAFYDLKGDEQSRFFWRHHFEGSQGVVFVADISDSEGFDSNKQVLQELMSDPLLRNSPFLVIANKKDLANGIGKDEAEEALGFKSGENGEVFLTCAVNGDGVVEGMTWLLERMNSV